MSSFFICLSIVSCFCSCFTIFLSPNLALCADTAHSGNKLIGTNTTWAESRDRTNTQRTSNVDVSSDIQKNDAIAAVLVSELGKLSVDEDVVEAAGEDVGEAVDEDVVEAVAEDVVEAVAEDVGENITFNNHVSLKRSDWPDKPPYTAAVLSATVAMECPRRIVGASPNEGRRAHSAPPSDTVNNHTSLSKLQKCKPSEHQCSVLADRRQ